MARKKKELPEMLPCKCGELHPVCTRDKHEGWKVICLRPQCNVAVRGFETEEKAIVAWNEEVLKHDAVRKRH